VFSGSRAHLASWVVGHRSSQILRSSTALLVGVKEAVSAREDFPGFSKRALCIIRRNSRGGHTLSFTRKFGNGFHSRRKRTPHPSRHPFSLSSFFLTALLNFMCQVVRCVWLRSCVLCCCFACDCVLELVCLVRFARVSCPWLRFVDRSEWCWGSASNWQLQRKLGLPVARVSRAQSPDAAFQF
jgi:hypothetical protein